MHVPPPPGPLIVLFQGETKGREGKCGDLGAVIRETRNEGELPRCGERDGVIVGDSGDIECGVARKANVLAGDGGAEENNIPKREHISC